MQLNIGKAQILKYLCIFFLLIILITFPDFVFLLKNESYKYLFLAFFVVPLILCIPVVFFAKNLKVYYFLLAIICSLNPITVLPVILINSQMNFEMIGLTLDSNLQEILELIGWRLIILIALVILFFLLFIKIARKLPSNISFINGMKISLTAIFIFLLIPFVRRISLNYDTRVLKNTYRLYYPFRISNAVPYVFSELKKKENYANAIKEFSFGARRLKNDSGRNVHLLIIGETSRYDHWSVNGYKRITSPNLNKLDNFISFSRASSGGTITNISIPLLITTAEPDNFEKHKKERSILTAFKEAGYRSYWVSNQAKFGFSGSIGLHYYDGDSAIFSGWGANESHFTSSTDSVLLPLIDSLLEKEKENDIFMIVHMIGSHWKYKMRYPPSFSKFTPVTSSSDFDLRFPAREVLINEYDNSILFSDHIINEIIQKVKSLNLNSTITYISDHGENLGDDPISPKYIHSFVPNKVTAHVPYFIWVSDAYINANRETFSFLNKHRNSAISSASNIFFTVLDMASIHVKNHDSTKSIGSQYFVESDQKILGDQGRIYYYKDLK